MREKQFSIYALAAGAGIAALYLLTGYNDGTSFLDWAQSWVSRMSLKANDILGPLLGSDPATSKALALIAGFEGFRPTAYPDPKGQTKTYSIGYGHQIRQGDGIDLNSHLSESQAYNLLVNDTATAVSCVSNVQTTLNDNQKAALISFVYNIGCGAFQDSTMLQLLNEGNTDGAANEFSRWIHANGEISEDLVSRRAQEEAVFLS